MSRLTDDELRAAAARRPGYATYPQYRPGQSEQLGRLRLGQPPASLITTTRALSEPEAAQVKQAIVAKLNAGVGLAVLPPAPVTVTLESLPAARVFDFQPRLITARPWWRRRWHWGVLAAGGRMEYGYAWTETGARWRTSRATRRAAR